MNNLRFTKGPLKGMTVDEFLNKDRSYIVVRREVDVRKELKEILTCAAGMMLFLSIEVVAVYLFFSMWW